MLPNSHILLIDDAPSSRHDLSVILAFLGEDAVITTSVAWQDDVAAQAATSGSFKCVILGHCGCPQGMQGLLAQLDKWDENLPAILLDAEQASRWPDHLRQRLLAVLPPPLSYNQLLDSLHRAQVYREVYDDRARQRQREPNLFRSLVGTSRSIYSVRQMMQQVADTEATVLILGE
jgi:sigma-54 specific flagellar transcriptional regulator A